MLKRSSYIKEKVLFKDIKGKTPSPSLHSLPVVTVWTDHASSPSSCQFSNLKHNITQE